MKVERKKVEPEFMPIVITLETEQEAEYLWHRLNCAFSSAFEKYCKEEGVKFPLNWNTYMWNKLNEVYSLGGDC